MKRIAMLLPLLLIACSEDQRTCIFDGCERPKEKKATLDPQVRSAIERQYEVYVGLADKGDEHGFILTQYCDSTLFSGLASLVRSVNMTAARGSDGKWYRRPLTYPECLASGDSKSTISRDMFLGILWWAWRNKRLDVVEAIYQYGKANDWIMGEGPVSRTYFTPGLQATLAQIIYKLGGKDYNERHLPEFQSEGTEGFAAHLDALHVHLRIELGAAMEGSLDVIERLYNRNPRNAYFAYLHGLYISGDLNPAGAALLDESLFPKDRLPTDREYCEDHWLWQRDLGKNFAPCSEATGQVWSGHDWLYVAKLILGK